jgi:hypothetical protein
MAATPDHQVIKHRFLLELWLEPREVAARVRRLRGRIQDLATRRTGSIGGLRDVNAFILGTVVATDDEDEDDVEWETES